MYPHINLQYSKKFLQSSILLNNTYHSDLTLRNLEIYYSWKRVSRKETSSRVLLQALEIHLSQHQLFYPSHPFPSNP